MCDSPESIIINISKAQLQQEFKKYNLQAKTILKIGNHDVRIHTGETSESRLEFEYLALCFMAKYTKYDLIGVFNIKTVKKYLALQIGIELIKKCHDPEVLKKIVKNTTSTDITELMTKATENIVTVRTTEFGDIKQPTEDEIFQILHRLKFHQGPEEVYNKATKW